jgi:hypothetical protein
VQECKGQECKVQECKGQECKGQECKGQECKGQECKVQAYNRLFLLMAKPQTCRYRGMFGANRDCSN